MDIADKIRDSRLGEVLAEAGVDFASAGRLVNITDPDARVSDSDLVYDSWIEQQEAVENAFDSTLYEDDRCFVVAYGAIDAAHRSTEPRFASVDWGHGDTWFDAVGRLDLKNGTDIYRDENSQHIVCVAHGSYYQDAEDRLREVTQVAVFQEIADDRVAGRLGYDIELAESMGKVNELAKKAFFNAAREGRTCSAVQLLQDAVAPLWARTPAQQVAVSREKAAGIDASRERGGRPAADRGLSI